MFFKKSSFKILIANLNNSVAGRMQYVKCPNTQMNRAFVMLLCRNGYLSHYEFIQSDTDHILVFFKFVNGRQCLKNLILQLRV
jgi:ribosomal protein S8